MRLAAMLLIAALTFIAELPVRSMVFMSRRGIFVFVDVVGWFDPEEDDIRSGR